MTSKQKWILVGIMILSIAFRFYQIKTMPGGLFPDEAANGLDINLMEQGHLQPFYERGNGREALFFYMEWASVAAFGRGPWQHHIVSALVGILAVLGCFLVTRKLFQIFSKDPKDSKSGAGLATTMALWASFFMAVSSWHVVLSRTAFRANTIPLFTSFTFYFGLMAFNASTRTKRYLWSIATGATFAMGFYTYIAYRIMVPLIMVAILWPLAVDLFKAPRYVAFKKFFAPFIALVVAFIVVIAPIAYYFWTHAGSFIGRSGQVSIFNPSLNGGHLLATFYDVCFKSMQAFFIHGDVNWRHNVSGEPFLSIIISPFFALGLIGATLLAARYAFTPFKNKLDWKYFLLAGWFWAMLIPVVTTAEGIPHGLRSIGVIPPVFMLSALGLMWVVGWARKFIDKYWPLISKSKQKMLSISFNVLAVTFVMALITQTYILYFIVAANSEENFYFFRSDLTATSEYLKAEGDKSNTYLILDKFSIQTVDYLTTVDGPHPNNPKNNPYKQVDPEDSWKLTGLKSGDKLVFCQSSIFDTTKFKQYHSNIKLIREDHNKFNQITMEVYTVQ